MTIDLTESLALDINQRVKRQYETYPYPDYSLFIPLRTQEAYASHSLFAGQLLKEKGKIPAVRARDKAAILIAGSGDVLPFIVSFWEPESTTIHAIDLSESNIKRARFRSTFRPHNFDWQVGNLEDPAFALPKTLAHVDSYGVLHHLAKPQEVIQRMSRNLEANGTCRIMVYNSEARHWIHRVQEGFQLLGLSAYDRSDLDHALILLKELMRVSPRYRERLAPMKASVFHHSARFVDTFFHAHEGRWTIDEWLNAFAEAEWEPIGLYDRYAELDDLPNPLHRFPTREELQSRVADRRFENNFEIYFAKTSQGVQHQDRTLRQPTRWALKAPPQAWFTYTETNRISLVTRFKLWRAFVQTMSHPLAPKIDRLLKTLNPEAVQRLARIGAVFPSNAEATDLKDLMIQAIHKSMEPPSFQPEAILQSDIELRRALEKLARTKGKSESVVDLVMKKWEAGQRI